MKTTITEQQQGAVTYYMLTDSQLRQLAEEASKSVLAKCGVNTEEVREKMLMDDKSEYKPISYWLKKLDVNRTTVWRWAREGKIIPTYMGKKIFFCQADFDQMFAKSKMEGA